MSPSLVTPMGEPRPGPLALRRSLCLSKHLLGFCPADLGGWKCSGSLWSHQLNCGWVEAQVTLETPCPTSPNLRVNYWAT